MTVNIIYNPMLCSDIVICMTWHDIVCTPKHEGLIPTCWIMIYAYYIVHVGVSISSSDGTVRYYPFDASNPTGPGHTHKQLIEDARSVISNGSQVITYICRPLTCIILISFIRWCEGTNMIEHSAKF